MIRAANDPGRGLYAVEVEVQGETAARLQLVRAPSSRAAAVTADGVAVHVFTAREISPGCYQIGQEVPHAVAA